MKLIIVSGLSGSGKSVALHTLEDEEYYCVDNLPPALLPAFVAELNSNGGAHYRRVALGVDARTSTTNFAGFPQTIRDLRNSELDTELVFLETDSSVLVKRFSETRRRHPLSHDGLPLMDAIESERHLLAPVKEQADLVIDTSSLTAHELRAMVIDRIRVNEKSAGLSILFQSFGFKQGVPGDSDFVFDVRCLPNPFWQPELRALTGRDKPVQEFLHQQPLVQEMLQSLRAFMEQWIPRYEAEKRRYMTVSVGCNGGQHRSVYLCEQLAGIFRKKFDGVTLRHRELR